MRTRLTAVALASLISLSVAAPALAATDANLRAPVRALAVGMFTGNPSGCAALDPQATTQVVTGGRQAWELRNVNQLTTGQVTAAEFNQEAAKAVPDCASSMRAYASVMTSGRHPKPLSAVLARINTDTITIHGNQATLTDDGTGFQLVREHGRWLIHHLTNFD